MIDYGNFTSSLKNLQLQYENYLNLDENLSQLMKEAVAESVVQRFEICYEISWKTLRRYLQEDLGLAEVPTSPRPTFRIADDNLLLASGFGQWNLYVDARIDTSHDYSSEKARHAIAIVGDFIDDAIGLYQTMTGETWE